MLPMPPMPHMLFIRTLREPITRFLSSHICLCDQCGGNCECLHGANISISVGVFPLPLNQSGIVANIAHTHSLFAAHRRDRRTRIGWFLLPQLAARPPLRRSLAIIRERSSIATLVLVCQRAVETSDCRHFHSFPSLSNLDDKCRHRLRWGKAAQSDCFFVPSRSACGVTSP